MITLLLLSLILNYGVSDDGFCDLDATDECGQESGSEVAKEALLVERLLKAGRDRGSYGPEHIREIVGAISDLVKHQTPFEPIPRRPNQLKEFEQKFCRKHLHLLKSVEFRSDKKFGKGIYAIADIEKDTIFSQGYINYSYSSLLHGKEFNCLKRPVDDVPEGLWRMDMLKLLQQRLLGGKADMQIYIDNLDHNPPFAAMYTVEDFELLRGGSGFVPTVDILRVACRKYALIYQQLQASSACALQSKLPLDKFTFAAFRWAFAMTVSRTFTIHGDESEQNIMLPCIDLLNHDTFDGNVFLNLDSSDRGLPWPKVQAVADKDIKKGEQVLFKYGTFDAGTGLSMYQFVIFDVYRITLHFKDSEMTEKIDALIKDSYNYKTYGSAIVSMKRPRGLEAERGLQFSDQEFEFLFKLANPDIEAPTITIETITNTWGFIAAQLKHAIDTFPHTRDFYVEQLESDGMSEIRKMLCHYMMEEIDMIHVLYKHSLEMME